MLRGGGGGGGNGRSSVVDGGGMIVCKSVGWGVCVGGGGWIYKEWRKGRSVESAEKKKGWRGCYRVEEEGVG